MIIKVCNILNISIKISAPQIYIIIELTKWTQNPDTKCLKYELQHSLFSLLVHFHGCPTPFHWSLYVLLRVWKYAAVASSFKNVISLTPLFTIIPDNSLQQTTFEQCPERAMTGCRAWRGFEGIWRDLKGFEGGREGWQRRIPENKMLHTIILHYSHQLASWGNACWITEKARRARRLL